MHNLLTETEDVDCDNNNQQRRSNSNKMPKEETINITSIYLNPVKDHLFIEGTLNNVSKTKLQIVDLSGKEYYTKNLTEHIVFEKITTTLLSPGIYIVFIYDGSKRIAQKKFVKL